MLIFITGGVRSGKSALAEKLALHYGKENSHIHYVATSIPYDHEMQQRVRRHVEDRGRHPIPFVTHEISSDLGRVIDFLQDGDVVLIDCLTTLLSNELFQGWESGNEAWKRETNRVDIYKRLVQAFYKFKASNATVIIVSNEIFNNCIPNDKSTFYYMYMLGNLHQQLVSLCNQAILVEYGMPIYKKGVKLDERNHVSGNSF